MPDIWGLASLSTKFALYVGVFGATGLVITRILFADLLAPIAKITQRLALSHAGLAFLAALMGLMLRGAALTGGADGMTDPEILGLLWHTAVGEMLTVRLIGVILLIAGLLLPRLGNWIALLGGLWALWSFAKVGHVLGLEHTFAQMLLFLHLVGIAFWIGILAPLYQLTQQPAHHRLAAQLGHRFGQLAMVLVPALLLAGLGMAWMLLGNLSSLTTTVYGQTLLAKIALVVVILTLAAANKLRFVPALRSGNATAALHLSRALQIETVLLLVVFAVTATLTSVLPLPN